MIRKLPSLEKLDGVPIVREEDFTVLGGESFPSTPRVPSTPLVQYQGEEQEEGQGQGEEEQEGRPDSNFLQVP